MTLAVDKSSLLGALLTAVRLYPGGVRGLAADMDTPEPTMYARLRGDKGYPLGTKELDDILERLRGQEIEGWDRPLHVLCHKHDHLAIPIPRALKDGSAEGLKQVSQMMHEVSEIAQALADGLDENKADGRLINTHEMKRIDSACATAMERIAETLERCRAQHLEAKKRRLVK